MVHVSIQNLSLQYGNRHILKDFNHEFQAGKFTAIMGKNGSGKTSLLRCIMHQKKHTHGSILIDRKSTVDLTPEEISRYCALVPQGQDLIYPHTVFETVLVGRLPYIQWKPTRTDIDITTQIIDELGLSAFSPRMIQDLSGGERQKVFIARALAQKTPVILLDEPITYLDIKHQLETMSLLRNLARMGFNIIMVVHDLNLALTYCDSFVLMKDGALVYSGDNTMIKPEIIQEVFDVSLKVFQGDDGRNFYLP